MLIVEFLDRTDHPIDGLGLVVLGVDVDRHHAAVAVEKPGGGVDIGYRLGHHRRISRQLAPFEAALVPTRVDDLGDSADTKEPLHTLDVAHMPLEIVDHTHDRVLGTGLWMGLNDGRDDIDADCETTGDDLGVDIVLRVRPQFGHPSVEVADLDLGRLPTADRKEHRCDGNDDGRIPWRCDLAEGPPELGHLLLTLMEFLPVTLLELDVGQQNRDKDEVCQDDHRDAEAGCDRHLLDHANLDQHDGDEADGVRQQRDAARDDQTAEGGARGVEALEPVEDLGAEGAHHLDPVTDSDRKYQKRHQYRHRIDTETEQGEKPQLPDDGGQRAADDNDRQLEALRVDVDEDRRDDEGDQEEEHDPLRARREIADDLCEADDVVIKVDPDLVARKLIANRLEFVGDAEVVELLTSGRVELEELGGNDRGREVVRYEPPHVVALEDVLADLGEPLLGRFEVVRDDVASRYAVLHHLGKADVGSVEGHHPGAVDAGDEEDLVGSFSEDLKKLGREDVPFAGFDRNHDPIGAAKGVAVLEVSLHIGMLERQHLGEAGIDLEV